MNINNFDDRGNYYELKENIKKYTKLPLTASNFASSIEGHNPFKNPQQLADELNGVVKINIPEDQLALIRKGIKEEPIAIKWYEEAFNKKVEPSRLTIPKWDVRIGCITDGKIDEDGILEVKCVKKMYPELISYLDKKESGEVFDKFYHDHIKTWHYDQIQGGLAITGRQWCQYIVFCSDEDAIFEEKVYFNEKYWNEVLYPGIDDFIKKHRSDVKTFE